jgi:hypothetical protein
VRSSEKVGKFRTEGIINTEMAKQSQAVPTEVATVERTNE